VDRSITGPRAFVRSNVEGTFNLLEACRELWRPARGSCITSPPTRCLARWAPAACSTKKTAMSPFEPLFCVQGSQRSLGARLHRTFGLPVRVSNCSNNYGPLQFPEKLIPLMILNLLERKPLPVYAQGLNVRDWLYVEDHCEAIWTIIARARTAAPTTSAVAASSAISTW